MKADSIDIVAWTLIVLMCIFLVMSGAGCSSTGTNSMSIESTETITYKHDMKVVIDGVLYVGTGILPNAEKYEIKVLPESKADRIIWQTCHRENVVDRPETGWFDKSFKFILYPVKEIENKAPCALELIVLHEKKVKNGFALFDFEDRREEVSLPANLLCNGEVIIANLGVAICQSAAGLIQQIEFTTPTVIAGVGPECDVMNSKDNLKFLYEMPKGKCTFNFVAQQKHQNGKRLVHRLNTIGYTEVPIR